MATNTFTMPPYLSKRALGDLLQRLRNDAGLSIVQVAAEMEIDRDTIRRWEAGLHTPKKASIHALGVLYGASAEEILHLIKLARDAKRPGLFEGADVPQQMRQLYESEVTAETIQNLELALIPGLLQIPEYQEATQEAEGVEATIARTALRVRDRRQIEVLGQDDPPRMRFVVTPTVLSNMRHLPEIASKQIDHLLELSRHPKIEIRVVDTLHASMVGSFTTIWPPAGAARPFAYVESVDGARYVEDRDVVSVYARTFKKVWVVAISLEEYLNGTWQVAQVPPQRPIRR